MTLSKEFIRDTKLKICITVNLTIDFRDVHWSVEVTTCQPRKRTWVNVHSNDDYQWRRLDHKDRELYKLNKQLEVCTIDEILQVKAELISRIPV